MLAVIACHLRALLLPLTVLGLVFLAACESLGIDSAASTPVTNRPTVTLIKPESGATAGPDTRIQVYAITQALKGITRVQVRVNDALVDDLSLVVATQRFDYQRDVKLTGVGQHVITVIGMDSSGAASDPVSVVVNVVSVLPTDPPTVTGTLTPTPFVIYVLATGTATPTVTRTPYVVYWTATPRPTATRTPTRYVIYVTATTAPTLTPTATPWRIYVTATPAP